MDWTKYAPYFTAAEFACKHTGKVAMNAAFMDRLLKLRILYGKPMRVSSGYRHKTHPVEAAKQSTGEHTTGRAADIAVRGPDALRLIRLALDVGFVRIGVQQKGAARFIHLGDNHNFPAGIWSY
jgi:zinc D-Ala-D-Ala carboxypeptidase